MANFDFLRQYWPVLADIASLSESYLYSDPNSTIMKMGMFAERLVAEIFVFENIPFPDVDDTQATRVRILKHEGLIPNSIDDILFTIRKKRNDATHEYLDSGEDARTILFMGYRLACWFMEVYRSLNKSGKARAAVVLPDNVLFADGDGVSIRCDLMEKCRLHTVLRLPTGIFYAQGVKTNVLFFERGREDEGNTDEVWFYDLRTNMPNFGKTNPLKEETFTGFEAAYTAADRRAVKDDRWSVYTREEIEQKGNSLDLGLIKDDSIVDYSDLPDPIESAEEAIAHLERARELMEEVVAELKGYMGRTEEE